MDNDSYISDVQSKIKKLEGQLNFTPVNTIPKTTIQSITIHNQENKKPAIYSIDDSTAKRLAHIQDICFCILFEVDPEAGTKLKKEIENKRKEKLKYEEFITNFEKISEVRRTISDYDYKKQIQIQLDEELAKRLQNEENKVVNYTANVNPFQPTSTIDQSELAKQLQNEENKFDNNTANVNTFEPTTTIVTENSTATFSRRKKELPPLASMKHADLMKMINDPSIDVDIMKLCLSEIERRLRVYQEFKANNSTN